MSAKKIIPLLVSLVVAFVAYRVMTRPTSDLETIPSGVSQPEVAVGPDVFNLHKPETEAVAEEDGECVTLYRFEDHPVTSQAIQELAFLLPRGPDIDAYRGVNASTIQSYAEQGDSAAMVLLGAQAVMRAFGRDQGEAIDWLNGWTTAASGISEERALSPQAVLELNDAAYWFYQASLYGRLYSLENYGKVRGRLFGGPVGLGWISEGDFNKLSTQDEAALDPRRLYSRAVLDIAPALGDGLFGKMDRFLPGSTTQQEIRNKIANDFRQALLDNDLSLPDIPSTGSAELDLLFEQLCRSDAE